MVSKLFLKFGVFLLALGVFVAPSVYAEDLQFVEPGEVLEPSETFVDDVPRDEFYRARVIEVLDAGVHSFGEGFENPYQKLNIQILNGPHKGEEFEFDHGGQFRVNEGQLLGEGETFIIMKIGRIDGSHTWAFVDKYRINAYWLLIGFFFILTVAMAGFRGISSILGLAVSIAIIAFYMVPRIIDGDNPLLVSLMTALLITFLSIFPSHGISRRTALSVVSIMITLGFAAILSIFAVDLSSLSGLGSEEAYYLQLGGDGILNLRGLLLAGILIGALGVLDDIATTQVASIEELSRANKKLGLKELYKRGFSVGKSHIISLVNTLVLAYAGASLPLLIMLTMGSTPFWVVLNSELLGEEIIRTLVGSSALVLTVPVSTWIAAWYFSKNPATGKPSEHVHVH